MKKARAVIGALAGVLLLASSAAHSLLGWKGIRGGLERANVPPELVHGVGLGWHFGGLAMLVFGSIVLMLFSETLQGRRVSLRPALLISVGYLLFGTWAAASSGFDPLFLLFVVPGLLLLFAAWPTPSSPSSS